MKGRVVMKKLRHFTALLLIMVLTLSGCKSTGTNTTDTSKTDEKSGYVDTLKVGIGAMLNQFDPGYSIGIASIKMFYNIFDTLLTTDKNGKIVGSLAKSWEWVDDKTLKVTLRQGVTFQNGEPCTAEDVKFTFDRILSGFGDGTVAMLYETLDSVEMLDDYTIQFKTKTVDAAFLDRLGSVWGAYIVPKDYLEKIGDKAFQTAPIGTGPYMMSSYSPEKMVLTRYDGFWGDKPNVGTIDFILYPEASARITALITGEVDIINDVTADMEDTIKAEKGLKVVGSQVKNIHIYVFKTSNGPMKSQKF
jgi:peptide/nickel transport system substrate-binding protein